MANVDLKYSKEWMVLRELSQGYVVSSSLKSQTDASLNKKIFWFLFNGAAGVIEMIKEIYGEKAVEDFYKFLDYFISSPDTVGHYYHSYKMNEDLKQIKVATQGMRFDNYLRDLKKELIKIDQEKGRGI